MRNILLILISSLLFIGCSDNSSINKNIASSELPNISKIYINKKQRDIKEELNEDIKAIASQNKTMAFAYYTANNKTSDGSSRWYISQIQGGLEGYVFSLMPMEEGKAGWGEVSKNAATIDINNSTVEIGNIDDNLKFIYKDWGLGITKTDPLIQEDIKMIRNSIVDIKWWFFKASNNAWYIINKDNEIYKFTNKDNQYNWQSIDSSDVNIEFVIEDGIKKIKVIPIEETIDDKKENNGLSTLKKTGQTYSYSDYDDGYYQIGVTPNYLRDNPKEVVIDLTTTLIWQDDIRVSDTEVDWQENSDADKTVKKNWIDANDYCDNLTLAGFNDWRLPTRRELLDIMYQDESKSDNLHITFKYTAFSKYGGRFNNDEDLYYWSSSVYAGDSNFAWSVSYELEHLTESKDKNKENHIRCVRENK